MHKVNCPSYIENVSVDMTDLITDTIDNCKKFAKVHHCDVRDVLKKLTSNLNYYRNNLD